jgi:hypothetical protein
MAPVGVAQLAVPHTIGDGLATRLATTVHRLLDRRLHGARLWLFYPENATLALPSF